MLEDKRSLKSVELTEDNGAWQQGRQAIGRMFRQMPEPSEQQLEQNLYQFSSDLNASGLRRSTT